MKHTYYNGNNYHFFYRNGKKVTGTHKYLSGCFNFIIGDCTNIYGKCTLDGDVSNIRGDITGIYGDASTLSGDLDQCEITEEERKAGLYIEDILKKWK